ncbi:MAG TPA: ATP-binding protein, partial [Cellvibrionaceae bacterium]|nr:ATP-binding protein [Cellvibrionaceae bacterium]
MVVGLHSLYGRLAAVFVCLLCILGAGVLALTNWSHNLYYQEVTQKLNKSLAMYIVQRAPLIEQGQVNKNRVKELADLAMVVNPIVEVYVLDPQGQILAHSLPPETILHTRIDVRPLQQWLAGEQNNMVRAQDPRAQDELRVFSAFPIESNAHLEGYLYVVLGGQAYQSLSQSLKGSFILKQSVFSLIALLIFATLCAALLFAWLTRPLRQLTARINQFGRRQAWLSQAVVPNHNEVEYISQAFDSMAQRIEQQIAQLETTDHLRRELISNVSHDLRTPIALMQGYLELLLKPGTTAAEHSQYVGIALKHCEQLTQLVKELFELSKLDAGRIQPEYERFALAELLQDVAQKFALKAVEHSIELKMDMQGGAFMVFADISLIERVLENLIDNALRYTPNGGEVVLRLVNKVDSVEVEIADTGIGLAAQDIPFIFERYYCANKPTVYSKNSTGLGLAIVKKILDLHHSSIAVESQVNKGSVFRFPL